MVSPRRFGKGGPAATAARVVGGQGRGSWRQSVAGDSTAAYGAHHWSEGRADMKITIRPRDASMQDSDRLQTDDWLAALRDDSRAARPGEGNARPTRGGHASPEVPAEASAAEPFARAERAEIARAELAARHQAAGHAKSTVRAVIGDELRMPIMWCEMGTCISWYADPAALGEADNRARAIHNGWRIDALGRLACPRCQQTDAGFWATCPVVPWDRHTALARAAIEADDRTAAAWRSCHDSGYPAGGVPSAGPHDPRWRQPTPSFQRRSQ